MRNKCSIVLHICIFTAVLISWGSMTFHAGPDGMLTSSGLRNLKYFTILSNLLAGAASFCTAWCQIRLISGGYSSAALPRRVLLLLLMAAVAVSITLLTVIIFLGPLYGYGAMYYGVNAFLHLIIPLASVAAFLITPSGITISFHESFLCMLPVGVYGTGYMLYNLIYGISRETDWYSFLFWGWPVGIFIFIVLIALSWGLGLGLRVLHNHLNRQV